MLPEEIYVEATGIYSAVVESIEITSSEDGRATLEIKLKVLSTLKGDDVSYLRGSLSIAYPTERDDVYITSHTSCDSNYYIGQELYIALYGKSDVEFGMCSKNILSPGAGYWHQLLEINTANKALNGTANDAAP